MRIGAAQARARVEAHLGRPAQDALDAPGSVVAMNPGMHPHPGYAALADVLVTFEGDLEAYRKATVPSWTSGYPPSLFWHLVYSTNEADLPQALELARSRGPGTIYITDRGLDNPWDALPSYWTRETASIARMAASCASPTGQPRRTHVCRPYVGTPHQSAETCRAYPARSPRTGRHYRLKCSGRSRDGPATDWPRSGRFAPIAIS